MRQPPPRRPQSIAGPVGIRHQPADQVQKTDAQLMRELGRPATDRPRIPRPGTAVRVLVPAPFGGAAVLREGTLISADSLTEPGPEPDPNIWEPAVNRSGQRIEGRYVLTPDPWPSLTILLDDRRTITTREARLPGSAGWLPEGR